MLSRQTRENLTRRWIEVKSSRGLAAGFLMAVRLTGPRRSVTGTSWPVVLWGLPLVGVHAKAGQGLRDGVDVDVRGKRDQIIAHPCAEEIQTPKPDMGA
jgi:hypothetical protein